MLLTNGAGKTTLASLIVEKLLERKIGSTLFFYCKHSENRKRTFIDILRALVDQLLHLDDALASCLHDMCMSSNRAGVSIMMEKLATVSFESQALSFVVLDGLDECEADEAAKTITWFNVFQNKANLSKQSQIRLLCIGQRTEVLQRTLLSAVNLSLENSSHQQDVHRYIEQKARDIKIRFDLSAEIESDLVTRVAKTANSKISDLLTLEHSVENYAESRSIGMFLFARLVLENLAGQVTRNKVMKELEPEIFPVNLKDA